MDYKLIKENFERATAKLTEESAVFTEEEKKALGFLQVAINAFRGSDGFASDVLEPLGTSTNAKVMEINTLAEQLVQELQELEKKIDMLLDGEPEEADYDTETGEFIGERKKKKEPTPEPKKEEVYGMGTSMDPSVAKKKGFAAARANGFVAGMPFREEMSMNPSTGEYTYKMIKI